MWIGSTNTSILMLYPYNLEHFFILFLQSGIFKLIVIRFYEKCINHYFLAPFPNFIWSDLDIARRNSMLFLPCSRLALIYWHFSSHSSSMYFLFSSFQFFFLFPTAWPFFFNLLLYIPNFMNFLLSIRFSLYLV